MKLNAELNEAIAEASVPWPLPTNPKTVSTLLQYPEQSNALERVCVITHSDTNALSNPVAVTHDIDVANRNVSVYSKSNVLDCAPFQYGNSSYAPDTGVAIMSTIETPLCGSGFSNFSQPIYAEVSNPHPAGHTAKLTKNASNSATVSFSNIPATENDKASRKPFQGLASNGKEKVIGLSPEFVEIGKPSARTYEPIIIQAPAPSLEPSVFDGNPMNYLNFVDAFDSLIAYSVPEPKRRLYFLLQYTKGPAHALVQGCQYMPEESGYNKARELLRQTFGHKFQIAKASIDSVTNGPVLHLNDKPALIRFSAELAACFNTL